MSPKSLLLFSSDQETARQMTQALAGLEFQVEHCPEIFAAVEKLTGRAFDVIVTDWDDGIEADFLLKTARDLKANRTAFTIAVAKLSATAAARQAGADMVLNKPVVASEVRNTLLHSQDFALRMQAPKPEEQSPVVASAPARSTPPEPKKPGFLPTSPLPPSPLPSLEADDGVLPLSAPVKPAFATPEPQLARHSRVQSILPQVPQQETVRPPKPRSPRLFSLAIFGLIAVPSGMLFFSPLTRAAVIASISQGYERTHDWLLKQSAPSVQASVTEPSGSRREPLPSSLDQKVRRINATPAFNAPTASATVTPADAQPADEQPEAAVYPEPTGIPSSLHAPPQPTVITDSGLRPSPSLINALEPVEVPEAQSQKQVVQKVQPSYPDQALRSGLQGSVVFQVAVAKDGAVRDLKLVRGSLLLGQAAYPAIRQWRYKPFMVNGRATETLTYVTVDFKLPAVAQASELEH